MDIITLLLFLPYPHTIRIFHCFRGGMLRIRFHQNEACGHIRSSNRFAVLDYQQQEHKEVLPLLQQPPAPINAYSPILFPHTIVEFAPMVAPCLTTVFHIYHDGQQRYVDC